jgi:hypothetical protein
MRKLTIGLLFALLAGFTLAQDPKKTEEPKKPDDAKKDTPAPTAATTDYYPLAKGAKWTYLMGQTEVVVEVESVTPDGAKLVTKHQGKTVANEVIKVTADGVYRTKINDTAIEKEGVKILQLKNNAPTKGDKWTVAAKVQAAEVKGDFEVKDAGVTVKVPAGEFKDAVYVEGPKFMIAGTETSVRYWFVPKQGVVKLSYTIAGTESAPLELKNYEPGK